MKRRAAILLLALMPLMFGSCSASYGIDPPEPALDCSSIAGTDVMECHLPLTDGRNVTCILYDGIKEEAMSCDWEHAEGTNNP